MHLAANGSIHIDPLGFHWHFNKQCQKLLWLEQGSHESSLKEIQLVRFAHYEWKPEILQQLKSKQTTQKNMGCYCFYLQYTH